MSNSRKGASRLARTLRSLAIIALIGGVLATYSIYQTRRDVDLATGPVGPAQLAFFANAATRPDLELFYKALTPTQRLTMAQRLSEYNDGRMAALIAALLGTFDPEARQALSDAMVKLAKSQPDAVAGQLGAAGSFQQIAISQALRSVGDPAFPLVVQRLDDPATRANAAAYLVETGPKAIPLLAPKLQSTDADVRLTVADALGKLDATSAVPALTQLYTKSTGAERLAYLSALGSIGEKSSESLLTDALNDETLTIPQRSQAALGLGRIGSQSAVTALLKFTSSPDRVMRESAVSALILAGSSALSDARLPTELRIEVAGGVRSAQADAVLARALLNPQTQLRAAIASNNRPALVPQLRRVAITPDGQIADAAMRALVTTAEGRIALKALERDPVVGGLALRRAALGPG